MRTQQGTPYEMQRRQLLDDLPLSIRRNLAPAKPPTASVPDLPLLPPPVQIDEEILEAVTTGKERYLEMCVAEVSTTACEKFTVRPQLVYLVGRAVNNEVK